ncbi:carbohydrate ABC transporter permease [Ruminiclostridium cellobioparum]|uniref:ABC-type sugar transport system, permease component n=1 Tax=Ruminiclostridium cellobioparum subsp. termitidis CT1112 TaxID=1195236 RepID=S0FJB5_RUMCE|nr:carbohydrate ABC transporter permease [Ruminiclostridium cellobioparum]EMS69214.1 ABC-type sugar transport system, permease component [Ruminiclostridium cellobioparum subsp. termitidis CT1112]
MKSRFKFGIADILIYLVLIIFSLAILLPMWHIFVISTSSPEVYLRDTYHLVPKSFSLDEYKRAFSSLGGIINSLFVSIKVTGLGTALSMLLTSMGAYVLSKKGLPGRNFLFKILVFTMFFSGGLVPFYVLVKNLHLDDTIFALTIPLAISTYNLIIMKNYFASLPESLEEAAKIDGYNDVQILFKIIIPVSKPVFAAVSLFYGVAYWNDYFMATLFISSNNMYPLQVVLRQMIIQNLVMAQVGVATVASNPEQFKMACIIIGIIPVLIIYPFVQNSFSKGIMMGAVKG